MEDDSRSAQIAKWGVGTLGLGAVVAGTAAITTRSMTVLIVAGVILVLLLVMLDGYLLWQRQKRKRASSQFEGGLAQESARAAGPIKDPNRLADLDKLRKRFMDGIEVYRSRGKDLYSVPWFVIIGESGSGKTEAIRHSNLDFPAGLNDPQQGTGGTINMDWWFTNHGIVLDTAGSMVFREMGGESASSPQWQEFLKLIKKNRANCPINGLLLVLSVDSLISDSAARIAEKAGRIARQLDVIQRTLDVRFPVSLIVTKCDKLTGFREFFESIDDPELQDQMVGWSNPEPLDQPFRPDLVDQHLGQVIARLRKRRLGILRDPQPVGGSRARRADEVDALYALPKSLSLIAPRLRRYLETIFVAGEFSAKPVFLRGIYFTSAMQTGADLDEAVWKALGRETATAEVTGTSAKDLGRPFFLRHVFLEKVFRERGLVTRATNTQRMLRRRKLILIGFSSAALLLVLLFGWLGKWELDGEIRKQSAMWVAAKSDWSVDAWHPIVAPGPLDQPYRYQGSNDTIADITLAEFHRQLWTNAVKPLEVSLIFWPARLFSSRGVSPAQRLDAQRVVFERSVVWPLIENTRLKMQRQDRPESPADTLGFQQEALKALIRLEADLARGARPLASTNAAEAATNYLWPYLAFLTETTNAMPIASDLADVFLRTYKDAWPPTVKGISGGGTLATNSAINKGLDRFFLNTTRNDAAQNLQVKDLDSVRQSAAQFEAEEKQWHAAAQNKTDINPDSFVALQKAKDDLDAALNKAKDSGLFSKPTDGLAIHLARIQAASASTGTNAVAGVLASMQGSLPSATPPTSVLFGEIEKKLKDFLGRLAQPVSVPFSSGAAPVDLDASSLKFCNLGNMERAYQFRYQVYTNAYSLRQTFLPQADLGIGLEWAFLTNLMGRAKAVSAKIDAYPTGSGYAGELRLTVEYLATQGVTITCRKFVEDYATYVAQQLGYYNNMDKSQVNWAIIEKASGFFTNVLKDLNATSGRVEEALRGRLQGLDITVQETRTNLIRRFAESEYAKLKNEAGFPIVRDGNPIDLDQVRKFARDSAELHKALDAAQRMGYPSVPALAKKKEWLDNCRRIVQACFDTNYAVRQFTLQAPVQINDGTKSGARILAVYAGSKTNAEDITLRTLKLESVPADARLSFGTRAHAQSPEEIRWDSKGDWGVLRLLSDPERAAAESDPKVRKARIPIGSQSNQALEVEILFTEPFPPLKEWPAQADW
jgi:hypothetical protein